MKSILRQKEARVALVIGNGINRYGGTERNSLQALLEQLALRYVGTEKSTVPQGVPFTEYFDLLELMSRETLQSSQLQGEFCRLMEAWEAQDHHRRIVTWAMEHDAPILTTNFDSVLSDAGGCSLGRVQKGGFTDFYPWESCYSKHPVHTPSEQFGIWHVNGMKHYRRSIRLGLTHYMGSV